jgi:hypothetical protein
LPTAAAVPILSNPQQGSDDRVEQAMTIFVAGILGVFLGMTLIYLAIVLTSRIVDRLVTASEKEPS